MYQNNNSEMQNFNEKVKKYLPGGVHYNFNMPWEEKPLYFSNTKGSRVYDMDGNEYLDLYARFGAMIVGHGNKEYEETLKDAISRVLCVSHCDMDLEVLELINQFVPCAESIRFGLSGTEIVQNALRLARAYTGKNRFIRFDNHYHGNADNIMGGKKKNKDYPVPVEYFGDYKGTAGRAKDSLESQSFLLPWNDIEALKAVVEKYADEIAAIIMEPVCVNGGSVEPKEGYLQDVRSLCDQYGIVLIFDEIITGIRMGLGGAQGHYQVTPDLATMGKAIAGGGVPVSALVGKNEIMKLLADKKVVHAGTFNGYPLGTAAIKSTLHIMSKENGKVYGNMNDKIMKIRQVLKTNANEAGIALQVQGPAGCGAYHCCDSVLQSPSEYDFEIMSKDIIINTCLKKYGIIVSSVSRLYPNILLTDDDVKWFDEKSKLALAEAKEIFDEIF